MWWSTPTGERSGDIGHFRHSRPDTSFAEPCPTRHNHYVTITLIVTLTVRNPQTCSKNPNQTLHLVEAKTNVRPEFPSVRTNPLITSSPRNRPELVSGREKSAEQLPQTHSPIYTHYLHTRERTWAHNQRKHPTSLRNTTATTITKLMILIIIRNNNINNIKT